MPISKYVSAVLYSSHTPISLLLFPLIHPASTAATTASFLIGNAGSMTEQTLSPIILTQRSLNCSAATSSVDILSAPSVHQCDVVPDLPASGAVGGWLGLFRHNNLISCSGKARGCTDCRSGKPARPRREL
jgi:hypothetical protein